MINHLTDSPIHTLLFHTAPPTSWVIGLLIIWIIGSAIAITTNMNKR